MLLISIDSSAFSFLSPHKLATLALSLSSLCSLLKDPFFFPFSSSPPILPSFATRDVACPELAVESKAWGKAAAGPAKAQIPLGVVAAISPPSTRRFTDGRIHPIPPAVGALLSTGARFSWRIFSSFLGPKGGGALERFCCGGVLRLDPLRRGQFLVRGWLGAVLDEFLSWLRCPIHPCCSCCSIGLGGIGSCLVQGSCSSGFSRRQSGEMPVLQPPS